LGRERIAGAGDHRKLRDGAIRVVGGKERFGEAEAEASSPFSWKGVF
jgi:hypothetical protein